MGYGIKSVKYSDNTKDWKYTVGQNLNGDKVKVASIHHSRDNFGNTHISIYTSNKDQETMLWKELENVAGLEITHNTEEIL